MHSINRIFSFFSKWMAEILRQPALMISLVLGPFLVLLAFGQGVNLGGPRPRTIIVQQPGTAQERIAPLPEELNQHITIVGETDDLEWAKAQLREGNADAVAVIPPDPAAAIQSGQQIPIQILTSEIDPVRKSYARAYLADQVATLNQRTIAKAVEDVQSNVGGVSDAISQARPFLQVLRENRGDIESARRQVEELRRTLGPLAQAAESANNAAQGISFLVPGLDRATEQTARIEILVRDINATVQRLDTELGVSSGEARLPTAAELEQLDADLTELEKLLADVQGIPPEVLSAPFKLRLESIAPFVPTFSGFYSPAVLALLIQHLAITLGALSMTRIRLIGLMDLLRTSPVRAIEVVTGNYLSYGTLCALAGALLVGLTVWLLNVPVFGSYWVVVLGLGLLIAAALGVGFVISMISSSEQQAAQIAMLVLLASIFFSGFVFSLDRIAWPIRAISYALPSTYAIRTLQDVMLRGVLREPQDLAILGATALVLFVVTVLLFRREFRPV